MPLSSAIDRSCVSSCATSQVISSDSRAAAPGDRPSDKRPRMERFFPLGKWVLALVLLCVSALSGFAPSAAAQTAHFSWAITTVGSGFNSPQGVAIDASGNIFVADSSNNAVEEITASSGYSTVVRLGGGFNSPQGVAVDASGNVFVADTGNNAVEEIVAAGGYTQIIPLGSGFSAPTGVAVDRSGNVFVADQGNNAVKEIVAADNSVISLGSGFSNPQGIAVDASGTSSSPIPATTPWRRSWPRAATLRSFRWAAVLTAPSA